MKTESLPLNANPKLPPRRSPRGLKPNVLKSWVEVIAAMVPDGLPLMVGTQRNAIRAVMAAAATGDNVVTARGGDGCYRAWRLGKFTRPTARLHVERGGAIPVEVDGRPVVVATEDEADRVQWLARRRGLKLLKKRGRDGNWRLLRTA